MKQEITMGSLFSGSGGFELAGSIFGIRPIWASEIEPFPILVTTKNFVWEFYGEPRSVAKNCRRY